MGSVLGWRKLAGALLSAVALVLGALPCAAQAMTNDCMSTMEKQAPHHPAQSEKAPAGPDCAIGCRLAPPVTPSISPPLPVSYAVAYSIKPTAEDGLTADPADPPPR